MVPCSDYRPGLYHLIFLVLVVISPKCPPKPHREWWQRQLCYQVYTRSFKDSDGDGVGDFNGVKEKIRQLSDANVQSIWPVPVLNSTDFTGYDATDMTVVDPRLGTLEDFESLISAAHDRRKC